MTNLDFSVMHNIECIHVLYSATPLCTALTMRFLPFFTAALIGLVTSLSLPSNNRNLLQTRPILNISIPVSNSHNHTNATSSGWPGAPFITKISGNEVIDGVTESVFLTIDRYMAPEKNPLQSATLLDGITTIEETIKSLMTPNSSYIDGTRVFYGGIVVVRFPAYKGNEQITNELAMQLLGAIRGFVYSYGPTRGFSFATVQSVASDGSKNQLGYFSLWISTGATIVTDYGRL